MKEGFYFMSYVVVGKKKVDYFSNKKKAQVTGVELYLNSIKEVSNGVGVSCLKPIYFNSDKHSYDDFNVGDVVDVFYNQYGSVENVILV